MTKKKDLAVQNDDIVLDFDLKTKTLTVGGETVLLGPDVTVKAVDLARAIGYTYPKKLGTLVQQNGEFIEGSHYFYAMEPHSGGSGSLPGNLTQKASKTLFLTRIGLNLALQKTKLPIGVKLRAYFAEVVMPAWEDAAAAQLMGAPKTEVLPPPAPSLSLDVVADVVERLVTPILEQVQGMQLQILDRLDRMTQAQPRQIAPQVVPGSQPIGYRPVRAVGPAARPQGMMRLSEYYQRSNIHVPPGVIGYDSSQLKGWCLLNRAPIHEEVDSRHGAVYLYAEPSMYWYFTQDPRGAWTWGLRARGAFYDVPAHLLGS